MRERRKELKGNYFSPYVQDEFERLDNLVNCLNAELKKTVLQVEIKKHF